MKKSAVVFAAVLLLVALVPQPVAAKVDTVFGIKAGVSLDTFKWSDETSASKTLLQPVFGAFASFNLSKSLAIQPEIYYLTLGGKNTYVGETTYEYKMLAHCLHVPVLAKVRLMAGKKITPIVFAGPAMDFLLSAKEKVYVDGTLSTEMDIKPYLKSTNLSVVFGAGLEYMLEKARVIFDIRYDMGLGNINNEGMDSLKTRALMFLVGVGF